ncbi:unnamed protein product [Periconia digitata]|uniref:Uncharacterized protein n=1 Tax=Periconia digitata TaxID=1303443 RepID=A0A9W4XDJ5_9PLEO|nr:unnamed protein product [Periconia digitata]
MSMGGKVAVCFPLGQGNSLILGLPLSNLTMLIIAVLGVFGPQCIENPSP